MNWLAGKGSKGGKMTRKEKKRRRVENMKTAH